MTRPLALALLLLAALPCRAQTGDAPLTRIGFGSCVHQDKPQPVWDAVHAAKPEVFLLLGDNIYGDSPDMAVLKRKYAQAKAVPGYKRLFDTCKVLGTWDDHDYGDNDAGADWGPKQEAKELFCEFFNLPADHPVRSREGVYHSATFGPAGKRVQVILLDGRYFRSATKRGPRRPDGITPYVPNTDADATVLGAAQWTWLEEQLRQPAEVRLLCSGTQVVSEEHPFESWANFPREREKLVQLIRDTKANGVVVLSGDRHLGELSVLTESTPYPLFDLTASGLNQANKGWRAPERNRHRVAGMPAGDHFGMVTIDWSGDDPRVALSLRDEDGEVTLQHKIRLSLLQPSTGSARRPNNGAMPRVNERDAPVVAGVLTAEQAAEKVNSRVTVKITIRSAGRSGERVYLNSEESFRDKKNFTVAVESADLEAAAKTADGRKLVGKTVQATGVVQASNSGPRLTVRDAKDLKVEEAK